MEEQRWDQPGQVILSVYVFNVQLLALHKNIKGDECGVSVIKSLVKVWGAVPAFTL